MKEDYLEEDEIKEKSEYLRMVVEVIRGVVAEEDNSGEESEEESKHAEVAGDDY